MRYLYGDSAPFPACCGFSDTLNGWTVGGGVEHAFTPNLTIRAEYRFTPEPPRTGAESAAAGDRELEEYLHLYLLNRGVLITPFHNMALMCPATTEAQVDRHTEVFGDAVKELHA